MKATKKNLKLPTFEKFMELGNNDGNKNESETEVEKFPHEIKSEAYWKRILFDNPYALRILDTVMTKQNGKASDKQMGIFRRVERGEKVTNSKY